MAPRGVLSRNTVAAIKEPCKELNLEAAKTLCKELSPEYDLEYMRLQAGNHRFQDVLRYLDEIENTATNRERFEFKENSTAPVCLAGYKKESCVQK